MINSRREKILAGVAAAAVTVALLLESGVEIPLQPFADLDAAIAEATSQADEYQVQVNRLLHDMHALDAAAKRSLPPDPGRASALYQEWLVRLLAASGIEAPSVNPSNPVADEFLGHRIAFSIECDASAAALAEFIDRFSASSLLQRITNLQIVNSSNGLDDYHRLALSVEVLALPNAKETEMLPETAAENLPENSLASLVASRQLLTLEQPPEPETVVNVTPAGTPQTPLQTPAEQTNPEPTPPPEPPRPPAPRYSPGQSLQFIGSVLSGETRRAWFVDRRTADEHFAAVSEEVTVPELTIKVLALTDDSVTVLYKSKRIRMKLGQTAALPPAPFGKKRSPQSPASDPQQSADLNTPVTSLK